MAQQTTTTVTSFSKALTLGEIHEDMVFPYPLPSDEEDKGMHHNRFAAALADIYAQVAVLSHVSSIFEAQGVEASGQERYIAETICTHAARRVNLELDKVERNDDERTHSIARLAYKPGAYGYALFED